jgi:hypothetical protein
MKQSKTFKVKVNCSAAPDAQPHQHELEIAAAGLSALGARPEGTCELQYTCPQTGEDRKVIIPCPPRFDRPYRIVGIS